MSATGIDLPPLYVQEHGPPGGMPLVLVHGSPDRSGAFSLLVGHLADRHVVVYDRRGYGRSLARGAATTMRDHAEDLLSIVERFGAPAVVVAHSFGSNPTMLAATMNPRAFAAVGLWEPPLPWFDWWPEILREVHAGMATAQGSRAMIERMQTALLGPAGWRALPEQVRERRLAEAPAFKADIASELEAPFALADVAVPAVVGYGAATRPEFLRSVRLLAEMLPDARRHRIDDAGHYANRTHPREYASFVRAAWALGVSRGKTPVAL